MTELAADGLPWLRAMGSLAGVLLLLIGALWLLRRYGSPRMDGLRGGHRLRIVASQVVDARTRLLLVRRDGVEHLLAVAPSGVTLIETFACAAVSPAPSHAPC